MPKLRLPTKLTKIHFPKTSTTSPQDTVTTGTGGKTTTKSLNKLSPKIYLPISLLVAGIGTYMVFFSQAASTCTQTLPIGTSAASIQSAIENAADGAVICLTSSPTSYGNLSINKKRTGYVTLQSTTNRGATLGNINLSQSSEYFRFESLKLGSINAKYNITSGTSTSNIQIVDNDLSGAGSYSANQYWLIEGNYFHDCGHCIEFSTSDSYMPSQHIVIKGNKFMGPNDEDMIRIANFRDVLIENNEFINNFEHTVPLSQSSDGVCHCDAVQAVWGGSDLVFRNNKILNGTGQGFFVKDARITSTVGQFGLGTYQNITVENNLIVNNKKDSDSPAPQFSWGSAALTPIGINGPADNVKIFNNTVWDNDGATSISESVTNVIVKNNIFNRFYASDGVTITNYDYNISPNVFVSTKENPPNSGIRVPTAWINQGSNNISGSPTFAYASNSTDLNQANWNYRLASTSKGIDKGTNTSGVAGYTVPTTDIDGNAKVDTPNVTNGASGFYDMGAYEYGSSGTPPPMASCDPAFTYKRPYTDDSPWNTPLVNPTYSPNNVDHINALKSAKDSGAGPLSSDPTQYNFPVYYVNNATPKRTIKFTTWFADAQSDTLVNNYRLSSSTFPPEGGGYVISPTDTAISPPTNLKQSPHEGVPIPDNVAASPGSDAQLIIINTDTGEQWAFTYFARDTKGTASAIDDIFSTGSLTRYNINFNGVPAVSTSPWPQIGAGVSALAGIIRPCEIQQGRIDHALAFAYAYPARTFAAVCNPDTARVEPEQFVFPARKSDGSSCYPDILEGTRLQLDPTISDDTIRSWTYIDAQNRTYTCNDACFTIAKALQKYGMYTVDQSGNPKLRAEGSESANWSSMPSNLQITATTPNPIPWTAFKVVEVGCANGRDDDNDGKVDTDDSGCSSANDFEEAGTVTPPTDTTPPTTTISSTTPTNLLTQSPIPTTTTTTASFTFSGTDTGGSGIASYECSLDAPNATTGYSTCTSPKPYGTPTALSTGSHTFRVRAKDTAGNVDATPATITWTVTGTTPPPSNKPGDVNKDDSVNLADISALLSTYGQVGTNLSADLDNSGSVNIADLSIILQNYGK